MCEWENGDQTCKNFATITCVNEEIRNTHVEKICTYMWEWQNGEYTCKMA